MSRATITIGPRDWTDRAACARSGLPAWTWDAEVRGDRIRAHHEARLERARAVCTTCPVAEPCIAEGLAGYAGGIRGRAIFPDESDVPQRRRRRPPVPR